MVEKTIMNNIEHNQRDLDAKFNDLYRDLDERFSGAHREIDERSQETQKQFDDVYRTIDSRIDKLAARSNAYDLMKEKKQLLKG